MNTPVKCNMCLLLTIFIVCTYASDFNNADMLDKCEEIEKCDRREDFSQNSNLTEIDLHERLFKRYNRNIMPRTNKTVPMRVGIEMMALSIEEIDEKKQTISVRAFLEVSWKDNFLTWNPDKFRGVEFINVKVEDIWLPDIALKNTFGRVTDIGQEGGYANIKKDGSVVIWPYGTYKVVCRISIASFPFDKQACKFIFSSWTNPYSVFQIKNDTSVLNLERYAPSGEWELENSKVSFYLSDYNADKWDHVVFELFLKRKSLYYVMNIMTPVLCISVLNVFCFILPSQDGERVTLSISIFLTLAVFLTIVNETMPESSDEASKFGVYVGLQLFGNALTIAVTTISLWLFHRDEKRKVPKFLKLLVRMMCMSKPEEKNVLFRLAKNIAGTMKRPPKDVTYENANDNSSTQKTDPMMNPMTHAMGAMSAMGNRSKGSSEQSGITWRMVSMAIDRFCIVASIAWHTVLLVSLIGSIASD